MAVVRTICRSHETPRLTPDEFVTAAVQGTRAHLERTISFLVAQPEGSVSDETWLELEQTLDRVDAAFADLRRRGYQVPA